MKIGDIVKNRYNEEFKIVCVLSSTLYPINTEKVRTGANFTFTMKGELIIDVKSELDLQVDKDGNILTFESRLYAVEDITETVEDITETVKLTRLIMEEVLPDENFYAFSTSITPYEASLKATKLELLAELTGLVEDNRGSGEIILKVKKLKKLLEL